MSSRPILIEDARGLVLEHARGPRPEPIALADALGRVLAQEVSSGDDVPGFDNSAMDGFAVRSADTAGACAERPVQLAIVDESRAGAPAVRALGPGEAIRISTGAAVPEGADAIVRVEDTDGVAPDAVEVRVEVAAGRDLRRAGEDLRAGDHVLGAGAELGPAEVGVLASVGVGEIACAARPQVAVLTTGDELLEPGEPLRAGAIRNSNSYSVGALVRRCGAQLTETAIVPDDPGATREALARALGAEIAVVCGGVSVGEHDHVRPGLAALGVEQVFWGVALRPGKPTYFGVGPEGQLAFGLPGNPVSAMVTFILFVRPAIRAMLGQPPDEQRATAVLDRDYPRLPARTQLVRCRLELRDDGWHATPTKAQGSHVLTSMLGADALAIVGPGDGPLPAGERVEVELLP